MAQYKITGWSEQMLTSINSWWEGHYNLEFPIICNSNDEIVNVETRYRMVEFSLYWFNYEPLENTTQV